MTSPFPKGLDLKLIALVKENPIIYNTSHSRHSDSNVREVAWQKIGDILHLPARKCRSRWTNIRDQMRRRIKDRIKYPDQSRTCYRYEDELMFMIPYFKDSITTEFFEPEEESEVEMPPEVYIDETMREEYVGEGNPVMRFKKRKHDETTTRELDSTNFPEFNTSDPLHVFLMTVGTTLRNFNAYYLNQAKSKIFKAVQDFELEQMMNKNNHNLGNCSNR